MHKFSSRISKVKSKLFSAFLTSIILFSLFVFSLPRQILAAVNARETMVGDPSATAVTDNFIAPPGVTSVEVRMWGGGGTGGSATGNPASAGGGAGGQYAVDTAISVTGGSAYAVTIASTPAAVQNGVVAGQDSQWVGCATANTHVCAKGGAGGPTSSGSSSTGAVGSSSSGIGDTVYAGGSGGDGTASSDSGGGGGGAGSTGAGGAGSGVTAGTGTSVGGGTGGTGTNTSNAKNNGANAGGGGSGGRAIGNTNRAGGNGGQGRADFLYSIADSYPAIVEVVTGQDTGDATQHTITMPASITAGDLLLVIFSSDATSSTTSSIGAGANWTEESGSDVRDSTDVVQGAVYYKIAEGGDTLQVDTADSQEASWITYQIRNAGIPTETNASGSSTNANPPDHTAAYGAIDYLWIATTSMDATSITTSFATDSPTNYSSLINSFATTTGGAHTGASRRYLSASSENPGTFTNATEQWIARTISVPSARTILGDGTDGGNSTIAPSASATEIDRFSLQGSKDDTVTGMTVTLAPASSYENLATVGVYTTGDTLKCSSSSWGGDLSVELSSCGISVTSSATEYVVKVTPKTHGNMPAVPGASYATTATVTSLTHSGVNTTTGTDTDSATITVDNASPNNATSTSATAGNTAITVNWTTSSGETTDAVLLRWQSATAGSEVPAEGATYNVNDTINTVATVACVITGQTTATALSKIDGTGGSSGCNTGALTNGLAYSYKVFHKDSNGNYDAGVSTNIINLTPSAPSFTVSGTAYANDGSTALGAGKTVALRVDGTLAGTGDGGTGLDDTDGSGNWSFTGVTASSGSTITIYMNAESETGNTVTISDGSTAITSTPIYDDHLIVKSDNGTTAITLADMVDYDSDQNNTDMVFDAESATSLITEDGNKLIVWTGDTFTPGGTITTDPSNDGTDANVDGDVEIKSTATLNMGANALSVGGDFVNAGTFSESGSPQQTTFSATATGHTIDYGTGDLDDVIFSGTNGGWSFADASNTIAGDITMTAGTLSGTTSITVNGGGVTGDGTINLTGGTFTVNTAGNFGGATAWTFDSLTIGGAGNATTTATGAGGITVNETLTIDTGDTLDANSKTWTLSDSDGCPCTPFVKSGTFTANASTFQYTGTGATNITDATYKHLSLIPAGTVNYTLGTAGSQTIQTNGTFLIGNSANAVTVNWTTWDPTLNILGNLTIALNANFTKSNSATMVFKAGGEQTLTDNTASTAGEDLGNVQVSVNGTDTTLKLGSRVRITNLTIDADQTFSHNGSYTVRLSGTGTPFVKNGIYTPSSGTMNYVGGAATTITSATYYNLTTQPNASSVTHTAAGSAITVQNDLTVGNSSETTIFTLDANDPTFDVDGSVIINSGGTLVASGTATFTVGGDWTNSGTFTDSGGTVTFNATDTGNTLSGTLNGASDFNNVIFDGTNGGWSGSATMLVSGDLAVNAGTLSGTNSITVNGGGVTGDGTINLTGGTFTVNTAGSFGGATGWTFSSLTIGGAGDATTTATGAGGITVSSVLTIDSGDTLEAASKIWTLSGSGTPFVKTGTLTAQSSTFQYTGTSATNIAEATYNHLSLIPAGTPVYTLGTAGSQTINTNDFTIGNGANGVQVNHATWDPTLNVSGNLSIAASAGTFTKSDLPATITLKPTGTKNWSDATNQDIGVVVIGSGASTPKITLTGGVKATSININASHELDLGSYTLNMTGTGTPFVVGGTFTPSTGTVNYSSATTANITATTYNHLTLGVGTYTAPAGTITISDDFTNGGVFTHNSGTVVFNNSSNISVISGATTFYNLSVTTNNKQIKFTSGQTFTIDTGGLLTLTGTSGNNVIVTSSDGSTQFTINHQGSESVEYITVSYSACHASSTPISMTNSTVGDQVGACWQLPLVLSQGAHRVFENVDGAVNFGTSGTTTSATDSVSNYYGKMALDNTYLYIASRYSTLGWRFEKRLLTTGALDSGFGTSGVIEENLSGAVQPYDIVIDSTYMYVVGKDNTSDWRIEKRKLSTGALCTAAECGTEFGTNGVVTGASSSDTAYRIVKDDTYMYVLGDDTNGDWRTEKRLLSTGALETNFGSSGILTHDSATASNSGSIGLALNGTSLYMAGSGTTNYLRIENRNIYDGSLVAGFGTGGVVSGDTNIDNYEGDFIILDSAGTNMYLLGRLAAGSAVLEKRLLSDGSLVAGFGSGGVQTISGARGLGFVRDTDNLYIAGRTSGNDWTVEKRLQSDGSLVSAFGTSGLLTGESGTDTALDIVGDNASLYVYGSFGADDDWRIRKLFKYDGSTMDATEPTVGPALAAENTAATLTSTGQAFRLRMLVHVAGQEVTQSGQTFKLQYAAKSGTCDTGFSGESYADITTGTPISYYNNSTLADGDNLLVSADDPADGYTVVAQEYEEANNFTNAVATIPVGQDGLWDFSLYDNGATQNSSYCIRAVKSTDAVFDSYTAIAEIAIQSPLLTQFGYVWRNDDGSETGAGYAAQENNMLAGGIFIGDNRRLRVGVSNSGVVTAASRVYRLEYASGACSSWTQVPTSAGSDAWVMVSSGSVSNGTATTDSTALTNPANKTFVAGQVMTTASETSAHTLTSSQFTEVEYNIEPTANVVTDTTYCFRLTNSGSATGFTYSQQPQAKALALQGNVSRGGGSDVGGETSAPPDPQQGGGGAGGGACTENCGGSGQGGGNQGGGSGGDSGALPKKNLLASVGKTGVTVSGIFGFLLFGFWW